MLRVIDKSTTTTDRCGVVGILVWKAPSLTFFFFFRISVRMYTSTNFYISSFLMLFQITVSRTYCYSHLYWRQPGSTV